MTTQPFNHEQALKRWTELSRLISVGAYSERDHEGNYAEDGIEESIDHLEHLAAQHGLQFVWHKDEKQWMLDPLSAEDLAAYKEAQASSETPLSVEQVEEMIEEEYERQRESE